jgi:hypothetical protein
MSECTADALSLLTEEYRLLAIDCRNPDSVPDGVDWERLKSLLITEAEWTPRGASALVSLVRENSASKLMNALALSIALQLEDGLDGY